MSEIHSIKVIKTEEGYVAEFYTNGVEAPVGVEEHDADPFAKLAAAYSKASVKRSTRAYSAV